MIRKRNLLSICWNDISCLLQFHPASYRHNKHRKRRPMSLCRKRRARLSAVRPVSQDSTRHLPRYFLKIPTATAPNSSLSVKHFFCFFKEFLRLPRTHSICDFISISKTSHRFSAFESEIWWSKQLKFQYVEHF